MPLRDYQEAAVQALLDCLDRSPDAAPLVVMPTGSGKSHVIAEFCRHVAGPDVKVVLATHVKELVEQDARKLRLAWPEAPLGICSAGMGQWDTRSPVVFGSIQTIANRVHELGPVSYFIVDEAHLVPAKGLGRYRTVIAKLRDVLPEMRLIGLTATEFRADSGYLYEGKGALFTEVCYRAEIADLQDKGWLARVVAKGSKTAEIDLSRVHVRHGEYVEAELERAALVVLTKALNELVAYRDECKKWLVFCCSIGHAEATVKGLLERGVPCELVTSETDAEDRERIVSEFKAAPTGCLVNVNVFTTGFDVEDVDLVVLLRATRSPVLYVQMIGRGMRPWPGKDECTVLDFGTNVERHGPVNAVRVKRPNEEPGVAPCKKCPECQTIILAGLRECPECGFLFDFKPQFDERPVEGEIVFRPTTGWEDVMDWTLRRHQAPGKPLPVVQVLYWCGAMGQTAVKQWVCPEHQGYPLSIFVDWWIRLGGKSPVPFKVDDVLARKGELWRPAQVFVRREPGKWPEVKDYRRRHGDSEAVGDGPELGAVALGEGGQVPGRPG